MISLMMVAQSSATAVRLRFALGSKHRTLCAGGFGFAFGFGIGIFRLDCGRDRYVFSISAAGFRALDLSGIAEIRTEKSKAALRDLTKSSIAATPLL